MNFLKILKAQIFLIKLSYKYKFHLARFAPPNMKLMKFPFFIQNVLNCFKSLLRCVWRYEISKSITIFCQKCPTSNTTIWLESWISTKLLLMLAACPVNIDVLIFIFLPKQNSKINFSVCKCNTV